MMSNAPNASGLERNLAAAGDRRIDPAVAQVAERFAERHGARGARVGGRQDRPADVERDAEVGRRRAAEDGEREVRGDLADALAPGSARAAPPRRRCRRARSRGRSRSVRARRRRPAPGRIRASSRASRPATRPNWLNRSSWRAVLGGIQASGSKSSTWAATCERNGLGSNRSIRLTGERPARSPAGRRRARCRSAVIMPIPVIQTRRRSLMRGIRQGRRGLAGAAGGRRHGLGEHLERRQRAPGDWPHEPAIDDRREPGTRGWKSCSIETRQPVAFGSICRSAVRWPPTFRAAPTSRANARM